MLLRSFLLIIVFVCSQIVRCDDFVWYNGKQAISYAMPQSTAPVVKIAFDMFAGDMKQVTGFSPKQSSASKATIRIIQLDKADKKVQKELRELNIPVDNIAAKKDGFYISVAGGSANKQLFIVGSDGRGTAYGILELSRLAGVSPWVWWSDVTPEKRSQLTIDGNYKTFQSPSVEYRGIFLNDEDWSLQPWSWMTFEPSNIKGRIGPRTYKEIFKLLLRLRANAIWPVCMALPLLFILYPEPKKWPTVAASPSAPHTANL